MSQTKIEWADATWNPISGCSPISEACDHCYARRMAIRLRGRFGYPADDPFKVTFHDSKLTESFRWKKPKRIFPCSMSDIFHPDVTDRMLNAAWTTMSSANWHTFMVLTKRPNRALKWLSSSPWGKESMPNLWLGVTAENQRRADERIPILLQIPAAVRFVSVEPMLGPVDLREISTAGVSAAAGNKLSDCLHWVIAGGETGPGARPAQAEWFLDIIEQCKRAGVPVFVKKAPAGVPIIREFPKGFQS